MRLRGESCPYNLFGYRYGGVSHWREDTPRCGAASALPATVIWLELLAILILLPRVQKFRAVEYFPAGGSETGDCNVIGWHQDPD